MFVKLSRPGDHPLVVNTEAISHMKPNADRTVLYLISGDKVEVAAPIDALATFLKTIDATNLK